jgi:hypothetical protein
MSLMFRKLIRWVFMVWFALLVIGILLVGVAVALLSVVWSLLMGRKPALVTTFMRFRQASQHFQNGMQQRPDPQRRPDSQGDVVDVQVKEVRATLPDGTSAPPRD